MVRAGVVEHPRDWEFGGYNENQHPKQRYTLIDREMLFHLLGLREEGALAETIRNWVDDSLLKGLSRRETQLREYLKTQADLASKAGMKQSALARLESHTADPRKSTLLKLAEAMGITVDQLVD